MPFSDFGCNGSPIRTPSIDRLLRACVGTGTHIYLTGPPNDDGYPPGCGWSSTVNHRIATVRDESIKFD